MYFSITLSRLHLMKETNGCFQLCKGWDRERINRTFMTAKIQQSAAVLASRSRLLGINLEVMKAAGSKNQQNVYWCVCSAATTCLEEREGRVYSLP